MNMAVGQEEASVLVFLSAVNGGGAFYRPFSDHGSPGFLKHELFLGLHVV